MDLNMITIFALACGGLGVLYALVTAAWVSKQSAGSEKMQAISAAIKEGATAFLNREYKTVAVVAIILAAALTYLGIWTSVGFIIGTFGSALAGYIGMAVTVKANVRTTEAAKRGLQAALSVSFKGGSVTGVMVVGLGLLGITGYFMVVRSLAPAEEVFHALIGLGFGCSLMSVFARIAGGIYTKAADVGADLVGKVEAGIPEDDPRNAAVIADNVGDNVGDCAGMAADLFETYAVTAVATMVLAAIFFATSPLLVNMMTLPLAIGGICIITSIIGTFFVKLGASQSIMGALYKGLIATGVLSLFGVAFVIHQLVGFGPLAGVKYTGLALFECGVVGLVVTGLIIWITEYYTGTDFRPVKSIAQSSVTGHGTNVIQGLAISMESTALPAIVIIAGILVTYSLAGLFGIAIATTTMLALAGMIVALDAFGPVTDNAGGIAEMAGLPKEVRKSTDALDAV
ncbi:MAG: sodium/proton-translocating pyrophosphatase, partial [Desulfobacteraceae bacterium]|nr:sodium/proton-translocating pyrophosphatase [Desulfobacteraceae bacterium]